jgi:hypothetical protein
VPLAVTDKVAVVLTRLVELDGCVEIDGGTQTVRMAAVLLIEPAELVTRTV